MGVTVTAPGKLFLLGEYAVLHGACALVAAVDARALVRAYPASDGCWRVSAPQLNIVDLALAPDGAICAAEAATRQQLQVFDAARRVAAEYDRLPALAVHIDTAGFFADGAKLGLGASAAVAAALVAAFARAGGGHPDRTALCERAVRAHRLAQNGEGSGADSVAAVLGGLLAYRMHAPPRRLHWPGGLHGIAVATGRGADTRILVAGTRALAAAKPALHRRCIDRLQDLAERGVQAIDAGDCCAFLNAAEGYFDALDALGAAAGTEIVTANHRGLRTLAARHGCVFKPTGAGGGDLGLVFAAGAHERDNCARALAAAGHRPLPLRLAASGMRVLAP